MSRRPSSWSKLSTIVERPGQPVALIPRKRGISCVRASVLPSLKNRDTFAEYLARYLIVHGGSADMDREPEPIGTESGDSLDNALC